MRAVSLFLLTVTASSKSFAAPIKDPSDILKDGIFQTLEIKISEVSAKSFESFFYSSKFEELYKKSKTGLSITIPLKAIPVTFGGDHQTSDAWSLRENQENKTKWDFSYSLWSQIIERKGDPAVVNAWKEAYIEYTRAVNQSISRVSVATETNSSELVTFQFKYIHISGAPTPRFYKITTAGLDILGAEDLVDQEFTTDGFSVIGKWQKNANEAALVLHTSIGSTRPINIERPRSFIVKSSYTLTDYIWTSAGTRSIEAATDDRHEKKIPSSVSKALRSQNKFAVSPGSGKYLASYKELAIACKKGERLKSHRLEKTGGPNTHHEAKWIINDESQAKAYIWAWTRPVTYKITADVEVLSPQRREEKSEIIANSSDIMLTYPQNAEDISAEFYIKGNIYKISKERVTGPITFLKQQLIGKELIQIYYKIDM